MNKIAEKIVAAMTPAELEAVVDDHYQGEAQTLTTAAEQNLLKLGELRGRLTPAQAARWAEIKAEYVRQRRMGGAADDPVSRLVGTLSGLGAELGAIRDALGEVQPGAALTEELRALRDAVLRALIRGQSEAEKRSPESWLGPRLDAIAESLRGAAASALAAARPPSASTHGGGTGHASAAGGIAGTVIDAQQLLAQVRRIEQSLVPVVGAAVEQRAGDTLLANKMVQIIELLEQLDARLSARP
jgi:hypothetical protein